ncbi:uncharacterized protein K460DRAFT_400835 [Cucurbitaria berberidis CBS 394.84]|uniref:Uncharacterized protein n=1 Tax=Cucurbitaria berberidis CBS 394.84 TaxID=1168544 RepID=A0A9P4GT18_9PLEO|nr:uncharacterized protein K460DRAFT_400835 [Cucurbitaria berberidis CBS 394.84]KAF1850797.1 hypothetical protein K460DRAFT_400835 [Cucurbitaria berberidis CBS 394.84]
MSTTYSSQTDPQSLLSTWHIHKQEANAGKRLGMRSLELLAVTGAMFVVPSVIQRLVHSLDDVYELLGRRARSPYATISWTGVIVALLLLLAWHVWLGRLSYRVVLEDGPARRAGERSSARDERVEQNTASGRVKWGRVLGRVVIPLLLVVFAVHFVYQLLHIVTKPAPLITANTGGIDEVRNPINGLP